MQYSFPQITVAFVCMKLLFGGVSAMEKMSSAPEPLSPHKQELLQIKCDLMSAIQAGIHGGDLKEFGLDDLDEQLKQSTPRKFKKHARGYFRKEFEKRCAAKGIMPEMVQALREQVEDDIAMYALADEGHSPASSPFKAQVRAVADRMNHPGLDVRKTYSGNTAYTRGGMLVVDEKVVQEVAPTTPLKQALLSHELTHDQEKDLVERLAYEKAFEEQGVEYTPTSQGHLSRFHEIFADIQEINTPRSAKAVHELTSRSAQVASHEHAGTHPKSDDRVRIASLNENLVDAEHRRKLRRTQNKDASSAPVQCRKNLLEIFDKENNN